MKTIECALYYLTQLGWSIIPIKENKRPYIPWEKYQKEKPTVKQVKEWWKSFPNAFNWCSYRRKLSNITC